MTDITRSSSCRGCSIACERLHRGVMIRVLHITEKTAELAGDRRKADLAIGFMPQLDAGFYHKSYLFSITWAWFRPITRVSGRILARCDISQKACHVTPSGTGHSSWIATLAQLSLETQKSSSKFSNYLGVANIIAHTDLLATVPLRLAELIANETAVRLFTLPFVIPNIRSSSIGMSGRIGPGA